MKDWRRPGRVISVGLVSSGALLEQGGCGMMLMHARGVYRDCMGFTNGGRCCW